MVHAETQSLEEGGASTGLARLFVVDGAANRVFIDLAGGVCRLGRGTGNDLALEAAGVSRNHARIVSDRGRHQLEDLHSKNGVRVNGVLLASGGTRLLRHGDVIKLGGCRLSFVDFDETARKRGLSSIQLNPAAIQEEVDAALRRMSDGAGEVADS
jgi:pSer/pThr/pTyr-binding forkhead associated (FHA) protein